MSPLIEVLSCLSVFLEAKLERLSRLAYGSYDEPIMFAEAFRF